MSIKDKITKALQSDSDDDLLRMEVDLGQKTELPNAELKARSVARSDDDQELSLVAWWDDQRSTGGPQEACASEPPQCSHDYAVSHGASIKVDVNGGDYLFYYRPVEPNTYVEPVEDQAAAIHRGLESTDRPAGA